MKYEINVARLRKDMEDYYGTAGVNISPLAFMDLEKVQKASDQELCEIAQKNGVDLRKYAYSKA